MLFPAAQGIKQQQAGRLAPLLIPLYGKVWRQNSTLILHSFAFNPSCCCVVTAPMGSSLRARMGPDLPIQSLLCLCVEAVVVLGVWHPERSIRIHWELSFSVCVVLLAAVRCTPVPVGCHANRALVVPQPSVVCAV